MLLDVFILLLVAFKTALSEEQQENDKVSVSTEGPCGQYGFRCIDNMRFQICPFRDSEGTTEEPDAIHECHEGFICDEDNPAYCSPVDLRFTTVKYEENRFDYYDEQGINEMSNEFYPDPGPLVREVRSDCDCEPTTTEASTTTTTENGYFTTLEFDTPPPYDCDTYGFFPDHENKSMFWYCDVPASGEGFLARHMLCGKDRLFNPYKHACILEGTIRDTRTDTMEFNQDTEDLEQDDYKFSCQGKNPGKYADDNNCQLYHVCLTKNFAPVRELLFTCPEETAFDPQTKRCSKQATKRCLNKSGAIEQVINKVGSKCGTNVINCKMPSRFRDVKDCGGYYLCYGDQLLEMRCPEFYRFDDNILECLPEGIAKCDEMDE